MSEVCEPGSGAMNNGVSNAAIDPSPQRYAACTVLWDSGKQNQVEVQMTQANPPGHSTLSRKKHTLKRTLVLFAVFMFGMALSVTPALAQLTPASTSVTMTAVVPEYLALTHAVNADAVMFNFGTDNSVDARNISAGWHNGVASQSSPSWGLEYNLRIGRSITVCAYATNFLGTTSGTTAVIPVNYLSGTSLQGNKASASFGAVSECSAQPGAILLDKISGADATSTGNRFGVPRPEGFSSMVLIPSAAGDYVPTPDTYSGTLMIVAQAI